jgi:glycosyltransferase involved in cell wall biosynthesis
VIKKIKRNLKSNPVVLMRKLINRLPYRIRKWLLRFPKEKNLINQISEIRKKHEGKEFYIFPSPSCPWGYMFQRPQQLSRALAKKGNMVFYMVDTSYPYAPDWFVRGIFEIEPNIYLVNDNHNGDLFIKIIAGERLNIWQYWPHQLENIKRWEKLLSNYQKIYDCIDHLETFPDYHNINTDFLKSVNEANIVLATAKNIQTSLLEYRKDCLYIPNGVNLGDFVNFKKYPCPKLDKIRSEGSIIIGYYGAIAEWFDFGTVEYIAKKNQGWTIVLVGEVYPNVEKEVAKLNQYNNIKIFKRVDYKFIPQLLSKFDVAILPFILNNITKSTSPVKIFEYLAGGKPVVSSPLPEILDIDCIFFGKGTIEFNKMVSLSIFKKDDQQFISQIKQVAQQNTWDKRIQFLENFKEEF